MRPNHFSETLKALIDCRDVLDDADIAEFSESEREAAVALIAVCGEIVIGVAKRSGFL